MSLNLDKSTWKRVRLGEVAAASKEKVDPTDGTVERYIAGEHMDTDDLRIHRWGHVDETDLGPAFHRRFRAGQVLYGSRRTYLRKVAVADFDGVCANTTFVVETKDDGMLLQRFLPFVMTSEPFHAFAIAESKGSVNPYVNWSDIQHYEFELPPLDDQTRIADLIWAVERYQVELERCVSATAGVLQRFLGEAFDAVSGTSVAIVDLCTDVIGGIWGSPAGEGEVDVLALGPRIFTPGTTDFVTDGSPVRSVSKRQAESRLVRADDIILERSGGSPTQRVGRVVIAGPGLPPSIPTDFQRLLRPNRDLVEPRYLFWRLRHDWAEGLTRDYSKKTTNITNLSVNDYIAREIRVPSLADQTHLLSQMSAFELALSAVSVELSALRSLRSSLLADVFGGD
jgi:type I restriction enzyme S subunit